MEYFRDEYLDSLEREAALAAEQERTQTAHDDALTVTVLDRVQTLLTAQAGTDQQLSLADITATLNSLRPQRL